MAHFKSNSLNTNTKYSTCWKPCPCCAWRRPTGWAPPAKVNPLLKNRSHCLSFSGSWRNSHVWLLFCANYLECMQICDDVTHIVYLCIFKGDVELYLKIDRSFILPTMNNDTTCIIQVLSSQELYKTWKYLQPCRCSPIWIFMQ